jgi:hypothetical protein
VLSPSTSLRAVGEGLLNEIDLKNGQINKQNLTYEYATKYALKLWYCLEK